MVTKFTFRSSYCFNLICRSLLVLCCAMIPAFASLAQSWSLAGAAGFSPNSITASGIATDRSGNVYVAFSDISNSGKATVMKFDGSSWQNLGAPGFSAGNIFSPAIDVDNSGNVYVAYQDGFNGAFATVMKYTPGTNTWAAVGSAAFTPYPIRTISLAINSTGTPYIAWQQDDQVGMNFGTTVQFFNGTSWVDVGAASLPTATWNPVIAIDPSDVPYLAYESDGDFTFYANVVKYNGSAWVAVGAPDFSVVDVDALSLAIDGAGVPYVAYTEGGFGAGPATVMKFNGTAWVTVGGGVVSAGIGNYTSIAIDRNNQPWVAFSDGNESGKATVVKFNGTSWSAVGTAGMTADAADYTALAIDRFSRPFVLFSDWSTLPISARASVMTSFNGTTWTGAVSTDWTNSGNWSPSSVPGDSTDVSIPAVANMPAISSGTHNAGRISLGSGATLSLASGSELAVKGGVQLGGTVSGAGKITLNNTVRQHLYGTGSAGNLKTDNAGGITINTGSSISLTGLLEVTSGTLATNDALVLRSTSVTNTAMVGPVGGAVEGKVRIERHITEPTGGTSTGRAWRLLTAPLKGSTNNTIYYNWQNNGTNDGSGVEIWGPGGSNGLLSGGNGYSMRTYDAATNTYQPVTNTQSGQLFDASGARSFLVFVSGHYGSNNIAPGTASPTTLKATGELITGTQNLGFMPSLTNSLQLMPNPYQCAIDFDKVYAHSTNISRKFWVIDPNKNEIGNYILVQWNGSMYTTNVSSAQNQFIQPGQSFFVEAANNLLPANVQVQEADKETATAPTAVFRTNNGSLETMRINLSVVDSTVVTEIDGTLINCHQNFSMATVPDEDGIKFSNFNESISVREGNTNFAIEGRPLFDNGDSVVVALGGMKQKNYKLELVPGNINAPGLVATLFDSYLNTTQAVSLSTNTLVSFAVDADPASAATGRFKIFFNVTPLANPALSLKGQKLAEGIRLQLGVQGDAGLSTLELQRSPDGADFSGIAKISADGKDEYGWLDSDPLIASNYYRVVGTKANGEKLYSNLTRIDWMSGLRSVGIYPNPVQGSSATVELANYAAGIYQLRIVNTAGQLLRVTTLNHQPGERHKVELNLARGSYFIMVRDQDGKELNTTEFMVF